MHQLSWDSITNETRTLQETSVSAEKCRSEFESDYHRIIHSVFFRRL